LPPEWLVKESITVLAPDGYANVIASSEPLDLEISVEKYATVQGELLRTEFPDFQELDFGQTTVFGDKTGFMRRYQWRAPDKGMVSQVQIYYAADGRGYTATATVPSGELSRYEQVLFEIIAGLQIIS